MLQQERDDELHEGPSAVRHLLHVKEEHLVDLLDEVVENRQEKIDEKRDQLDKVGGCGVISNQERNLGAFSLMPTCAELLVSSMDDPPVSLL